MWYCRPRFAIRLEMFNGSVFHIPYQGPLLSEGIEDLPLLLYGKLPYI